ncbi:EVE domain-containing protein [Halobacteriovorax sp. GB3]|uniref:EVE domain-containing protein n=1 Tax=Halobacteriovorax sp. GB3 TaxID=2719615 RepID=UPI002361C90B|nr:EVE domain-containing protein [Halobacteriovorax sp. GB3]MDD0853214.1 EVE domain-containing protein [Halobacteriovorax sp. GB3]
MNYWLMKSEPDTFSIDDLKQRPKSTEHWDGVRNYQARNFMRDEMKKGDLVLFYHSSCKVPGVAGIAKIVKEAYPDHTAFDKNSNYYDPKSSEENPRWFMVDVKFEKKFKKVVTLKELKTFEELKEMKLLQKGSRLSIMPVTKEEFDFIQGLS